MNQPTWKLLLVEDLPIYVSLVRQMLDAQRMVLDSAASLEQACQQTQDGAYDLILLDLGLPDSQGLDTFTRLHNHCPATPIVIFSGLDDEQLAVRAVQSGAQDYLIKGAYLIQGEAGRSLLNRSIAYAIERHRIQQELMMERSLLEQRVDERMAELHQANRQLEVELAARTRYEFMINTSKDPTSLIDRQYTYLAVNDAYCAAQGLPRQEIIGRTVGELWGAANFKAIFGPLIEQAFGGLEQHFEGWLTFKQLGLGYFEIFFYPFSVAHQVSNVVIVFHDETARKASEGRVRQHNYRLNILRQINQASLSARLPQDVAQVALEHFNQLVPYDRADLILFGETPANTWLISGDASGSTRTQAVNFLLDEFHHPPLPEGQAHQAGSLQSRSPDAAPLTPFEKFLKRRGQQSYLVVPLYAEGQMLGVFSLSSKEMESFSDEHIESAQAMSTPLALMMRNTQLLAQVSSANQHLRTLTSSLVSAQEDERQRISLELHDEAGQFLTALKLSLDMLKAELPELPEALQGQVNEAAKLTEVVIDRLRSLAHGLRPPALDTVGLYQALLDYCQRIARQTGLRINYRGSDVSSLPEYIQTSLYRVAQEALTNVVKHAAASQVEVSLIYDAEQVCLTVQDDGRGFLAEENAAAQNAAGAGSGAPAGIGLLGIQDRIEAIGGKLSVQTQPGSGTLLTASVPLGEPA